MHSLPFFWWFSQRALCRAAVPQAPALIARMGANSPAAVPCLLAGCVAVYQQASGSSSIAAVCVNAVRQLANLSPREGSRALAMLRQQNESCMLELQLELAIRHDTMAALCLLIEHLSRDDNFTNSVVSTGSIAPRRNFTSVEKVVSPSNVGNSSLRERLRENPNLLGRAVQCLCHELSDKSAPLGRISMVLTAYTLLLTRVPNAQAVESAPLGGPEQLLACLEEMRRLLNISHQEVAVDAPRTSQIHRANDLLVVALISTVSIFIPVEDCLAPDHIEEKVLDLIKQALKLRGASTSTGVLLTRVALALKYADARSLCEIIETTLNSSDDAKADSLSNSFYFTARLTKLCAWLATKGIFESEYAGENFYDGHNVFDPCVALQMIECKHVPDLVKAVTVKRFLSRVLSEPSFALLFLRFPLAASFVEKASLLLRKGQERKLPLVLPVQVEALATQALLRDSRSPGQITSLFLIQVFYCFLFSESDPCSPFRFDPRMLPLKQVYLYCLRPSVKNLNERFASGLNNFIDRSCPDVRRAQQYLRLKSRGRFIVAYHATAPGEGRKRQFAKLLKKFMAESHVDPCGLKAEAAFIEASHFLSDGDLISISASALISRPFSPPPFLTYPMLYRDPLSILKCPLDVWSRRGVRRIALAILTSLLDTNNSIVREEKAASEDVIAEFLSSRNELIVRSLLSVATSHPAERNRSYCQCGMTSGLIRKMIGCCGGLSALLVKHGLSESELDWMIESVPEIVEDTSALRGVLAERSPLTAAERVVAADGILRVVIAHGHRSNGDDEVLAYAALTQLVSSFFLIVGPVGVPVNTLVGEGNGLDATQVSRKAAFRMLNCLQKVNGSRIRLKNACAISLHKFMGMCKGESIVGAVPSAIAGRQKSLLKDLVDSVGKALDGMGSGIQN